MSFLFPLLCLLAELLGILQSLLRPQTVLVHQPDRVCSLPLPEFLSTAGRLLLRPLLSGWLPLSAPTRQQPAPRLASSKRSRMLSAQWIISDATFDTVLVGFVVWNTRLRIQEE